MTNMIFNFIFGLETCTLSLISRLSDIYTYYARLSVSTFRFAFRRLHIIIIHLTCVYRMRTYNKYFFIYIMNVGNYTKRILTFNLKALVTGNPFFRSVYYYACLQKPAPRACAAADEHTTFYNVTDVPSVENNNNKTRATGCLSPGRL